VATAHDEEDYHEGHEEHEDLLLEGELIVELKSIEEIIGIHEAQLLT